MSDIAREIAQITAKYKREMVALTDKYLHALEALKEQLAQEERTQASIERDLKEKIETEGLTYFG
jgi:predicted transcriptional regulator